VLSFLRKAQRRIFPLINPMECCSRQDSFLCSSRRQDSGQAGVRKAGHRGPAYSCWCGNVSRIYFESGVAKIMGGDPQWRNFTALDEYYQNGPLPTWVGWHMQHLPHWFHAATAFGTLALELAWSGLMFLPRRLRILCFLIITPWQIGIILSANYTFLNYLVLALGVLLVDDQFLVPYLPRFLKNSYLATKEAKPLAAPAPEANWRERLRPQASALKVAATAVMLTWMFYATLAQMAWMVKPWPLPTTPVSALEPFRIANRYGLFAVMTRGRYEIEFQGSDDGQNWLVYPFRYKPQDPSKAPGIYAPYQPALRLESVVCVTEHLAAGAHSPYVRNRVCYAAMPTCCCYLRGNPFPHAPPRQVRAVVWQYWFTTPDEKRSRGAWWRRQQLGLYAPTLGAPIGWKNCRLGMATCNGTSGMNGSVGSSSNHR